MLLLQRPRLSTTAWALLTLYLPHSMAADISATVPSDGGFVIRDAGSGQPRFRVQGDGQVRVPALGTEPAADRLTCFDGPSGRLGPCAAGIGVGPTGATGAAGPAGPAGPIGPAGPVGPAGTPGPAGPMGATGAVGPTGAIGPMGPAGPIGPMGPSGPTGATGPTGPIGPQGTAGPIGETGPVGPPGSGALMLRDASGAALGTVIGMFAGNDSYVTILTTSRHYAQIRFDGRLHNVSELFFTSKDCSGPPYLGSGTQQQTRRYARTLVSNGKDTYMLSKPDERGLSESQAQEKLGIAIASIQDESSGACVSVATKEQVFTLESVSLKSSGLPDSIVVPLQIEP
ncbi:MAG: collagen-like protein [Burkholderiales bacterium]|nr:collagen-like protein [Burkholderiales bacterium]